MLLASRESGNEGGMTPGTGGVEYRNYVRFALNAPATIWRENTAVKGQVINMSLGGAFIKLENPLLIYEAVTVTIHDHARPLGLLNDLPATVVRRTDEGCGIRFERMLLERGVTDSLNGPSLGAR